MRKGQVLIEVVIAIMIAGIALVALAGTGVKSVNNSAAAQRRAQAVAWAQKAIEIIRTLKADDWGSFGMTGTHQYCYDGVNMVPTSACSPDMYAIKNNGLPTEFNGQVDISYTFLIPANPLPTTTQGTITSTITWYEAGRQVQVVQTAVLVKHL